MISTRKLYVLLETDNNKDILTDFVFTAWLGAEKAKWLNNDYEIIKTTIKGLSHYISQLKDKHNFLPIGSIEYMKKAFELSEIQIPEPINIPSSLVYYINRRVWINEGLEGLEYPVFIKPNKDLKLFTGFVATKKEEFILYPELKGFNGEVFCSEPIQDIISEWRCYIHKGKIVNISHYSGDPLMLPNISNIKRLIKGYKDQPIGYTIDVAIYGDEFTNDTTLIEINDGWAIGSYGCDPQEYFQLLKDRWFELCKTRINKKYSLDWMDKIIGLTVEDAIRYCDNHYYSLRIVKNDSHNCIITDDMRIDRIGVDVANGLIIDYYVG